MFVEVYSAYYTYIYTFYTLFYTPCGLASLWYSFYNTDYTRKSRMFEEFILWDFCMVV